ncbi:ATP-grasp domain-containing protein [Mesorhizobium sp. M2A.F.Ca.ET.037.01.1.1]|uniref:D-alanine--D-alanine ligase family protein n=1 Tax=Mesorhizobium sp. M2A.F.Ca.ET.037.01.1.1 TaxID=2496748 RepID=UPI000FCAD28F|nr:ATP-grasp domain-containing protein [Mesorhizobium sp. M2A.F.Ca.ET.037.01.1.1]RUX06394.1 ATP-grasp domain-containing protein [Mesorhizobium sp. M2A.F.Ca.ET.037.01.1.1]
MRVAVVCNIDNDHAGVINRFGRSCPGSENRECCEEMVAALQEGGHDTLLCEGDKGLLTTLERFMPPDLQARPSGIVFNYARGIQGESRYTHLPAVLEMAGVPYTGSSPLGHAIADDKVFTKQIIRASGVPTPNFRVMRQGTESIGDLRFPVVVKPRREGCSYGLQLVHNPAQLRQAVEAIVTHYEQDALVEEYIDGREITVALLGNAELEVLPLVEQDFGDAKTPLYTWEAKHIGVGSPVKVCPAQLDSKLATMLREISAATFRACLCRDLARVDLRIDRSGQPFVLEINANPDLSKGASFPVSAKTAGHSFSSLINRILDLAHTRYFGSGIPKPTPLGKSPL